MKADTTPSEFKVGQAICNRWNGDTDQPYASADWLAETTGFSVRQVRRALAGLREKGWLAQHSRGGRRGDQSWSSRWRLTIPQSQRDMSVIPNVTPVSSQRDMDVTPVDPNLDPIPRPNPSAEPPLGAAVLPEKQGGEDFSTGPERQKWVNCPQFSTESRTCPTCHVNNPCAVRWAEVQSTLNGATDV
jgi:hypothetical protein